MYQHLAPFQVYSLGILLLATTVLMLLSYRIYPAKTLQVVKTLRFLRIIHYGGICFGGFALAWVIGGRPHLSSSDYLIFPALFFMSFFSFQSAVFVNDWFDRELDRLSGMETPLSRGLLSARETKTLILITVLLSLLLALSLNWYTVLFISLFHVASTTYSVPPLRLKRFYPLSIFTISCWALVMMLSGFSVIGGTQTFSLFPRQMALLVLATLTLAFGTKDVKDVKGDKEKGVSSIFTLLGLQSGKRINALLILTGYLLAPVIVRLPRLFILAIPSGLVSSLISLYRGYREWMIFVVYYIFGLTILFLILQGKLFQ